MLRSTGLGPILLKLVALDKAIDTSFGIHNFLLTRIIRVTVATDFYSNLVFSGTKHYFVATNTSGSHFKVLGVNSIFHCQTSF